MLNNSKIKIMAKLAIYEQGEGKNDIRTNSYYKIDYIRFHILKTIVSITIGYLLLAALFFLYNMEYFISHATELNYRQIGMNTLILYIIIVMAYAVATILIANAGYKKSRKNLVKYNKGLKELSEIYQAEKTETK